jgi:hypothetical protein
MSHMTLRSTLSLIALLLFAPAAWARENVLIIGGAGHTGAAVAQMLVARGDRVTVFVRRTTNRAPLAGIEVEYLVGDAMKKEEVAAALKGKRYSVIFETVQVAPGGAQSYAQVYENFVPLAKKMRVKQFLGLGSGCGDRAEQDCPLSPPLYKLAEDMTRAEHVLRDSGVPYTIIRIGALVPNPRDPAFNMASGKSFLTTETGKFGAVLRADLNQQVMGCIGSQRCINKIFVIDDLTIKPQLDHWLCKRTYETDTVRGFEPRCGAMPPITEQQLKGTPQ